MSHHQPRIEDALVTRRDALRRAGMGFGSLALGTLLADNAPKMALASELDAASSGSASKFTSAMAPKAPRFAPRAKRVMHLFMNGGPSQVDTFDPKPSLTKYNGQAIPLNLSTERKTGAALGSPFGFKKYGQSGLEVSDIFRHVGEMADDLCVIRSMHADVPNHEPSLMLMNCGDARQVRPSLGSWLLYGLGSENQNLPGFVVLCPGGMPIAEAQNWQSGFLPGIYQGTYVNSQHTEIEKLIEHIRNGRVKAPAQRAQLDLLMQLNRDHQDRHAGERQLEARIQSFELAFRMQSEAGDAFDTRGESEETKALYGPGVQARQLLVARRLLERGVRYVQVYHGAGQPWDSHDDLATAHKHLADQCDRPIAALLKDLKRLGMLDETLVIWGGEFGRTPTSLASRPSRTRSTSTTFMPRSCTSLALTTRPSPTAMPGATSA